MKDDGHGHAPACAPARLPAPRPGGRPEGDRARARGAGPSLLVLLALAATGGEARAEGARAIATFHSVGIYWSPEGGSADRHVAVRYREPSGVWRDGLAMRWNPIAGTDEDLAPYRGSLVHLRPGTGYEVQLTLEGTAETTTLTATTWSEAFPEGEVVAVAGSDRTLEIRESGTPDAYRVYDGSGATIDLSNRAANAIEIDASYVIVRNLVLRGAADNGIRIYGGHDIVIEDCDISAWGAADRNGGGYGQNLDAAIYSSAAEVARVVVQRCRLHHPSYDSNNWLEENCNPDCGFHPSGPQAIVFVNTAGNHVFRYNEAYSDAEHYFNDVFGGGSNGSYHGFPGPDSDIYGNYIANCWDDGIESEGGNRNTRIWNNYVEHCFMALANAATSIGPLYVWRNVSGQCWQAPGEGYGHFMKMGYAGSESWMTGHMYLFHNTILNVDDQGCGGLGGGSRLIHHAVTLNNVLHVRSSASHSISTNATNTDDFYDYDLYSARVPDGHEVHGVSGVPSYEVGRLDFDSMTGDFRLLPTSPGYDQGTPIPSFNDGFEGAAPDMGAHEAGSPPVVYGLLAGEPASPPCEPGPEVCGNGVDDDCDGLVDEGCGLELRVPRLSSPPRVDGDLADLAAGASLVLEGERGALGVVTAAWDETNLYLGYEVADTDLRGHVAAGEDGSVWRDDAVEVYLDPLHDGGAELRPDDRQIIVSARGALYQTHEGAFGHAVRLEGTLGDDLPDVGFGVELAIPWSWIGLSPAEGLSMGADFAVDDRDGPDDGSPNGGVYQTFDWAGLTRYRSPDRWGTLVLVGAGGDPDGGPGDGDLEPDAGPDGGPGEGGPDGGVDGPEPGCGCRAGEGRAAPAAALAALGLALLLARLRAR